MSSEGHVLAPTLWRTCRALANLQRLRLVHCLLSAQSTITVSTAAAHLKTTTPTSSQYLRALNARGLLAADRVGRQVRYRAAANPDIPSARILLIALKKALDGTERGFRDAFRSLTGFTHPRRVEVIRAVSLGFSRPTEIGRACHISRRALARHVAKLARTGYLVHEETGYRIANPRSALPRALLDIALSNR